MLRIKGGPPRSSSHIIGALGAFGEYTVAGEAANGRPIDGGAWGVTTLVGTFVSSLVLSGAFNSKQMNNNNPYCLHIGPPVGDKEDLVCGEVQRRDVDSINFERNSHRNNSPSH